ncbi:MAG: hypothetical protein GX124_07510 [Clostridiales bacterium]|nr:hypothetical protein [Clostridiales bacterium]
MEKRPAGGNKADPGPLIHYPDFEKLKAAVGKLRTELSMLVLEKDELLLVECRNIEMLYMLAVGGLEYKAFRLQCRVLRLRRKAEMIQARKNRQERVSLPEIEEALDAQFAEYQARLEEKIGRVNAALERSRGQPLSVEQARELKKRYRNIVKALHPDLHPELGGARLQLFYNAVTAYENGDLDGLNLISAMAGDTAPPDAREDGIKALAREKARLEGLLEGLRDRIARIRAEYPYTMKAFVRDEKQIGARKAELEAAIAQWQEALAACQARIREMTG